MGYGAAKKENCKIRQMRHAYESMSNCYAGIETRAERLGQIDIAKDAKENKEYFKRKALGIGK